MPEEPILSSASFGRIALVTLSAVLGACASDSNGDPCGPLQTDPGPTMRPGDNCLRCHQDGFGDPDAPPFTAAGTVFASPHAPHCEGVEGVKVVLTGADGGEITLVTNEAGNFWTQEPLTEMGPGPRLEFEGRTIEMVRDLPGTPACNACHSDPPVGGAPGKIFNP